MTERLRPVAATQRRRTIEQWLRALPPPGPDHLLIGATGHLLLSALEREQATEHLGTRVLPALLASEPAQVTLVTGLAPGADLLFKRLAADWLRKAGIAFTTAALLPVPVDVLVEDWVQKSRDEAAPVSACRIAEMRREITEMLADCEVIVDLLPAGADDARLGDAAFRQAQYRRLAAVLAEQTDVLIALLRAENPQQPGGTAEVVEWRRNPARIPHPLSTLALRMPRMQGLGLMIIDPAVAVLDNWRDPAGAELTSPDGPA